MAGKAYLGIDAGTSVVKAAIFDENGDALAVQGRSIPLMHDRGGIKGAVEQDFDVILATMSAVVSDAIARGRAGAGVGGADRAGRRLLDHRREVPPGAPRPVVARRPGRRTGRRVGEVRRPAGGVRDQRRGDVPRRPGRLSEVARRERAADAGPRGHRGLLQGRALRPAHRRARHRPVGRVAALRRRHRHGLQRPRAGADRADRPALAAGPDRGPGARRRVARRGRGAARAARRHPGDLGPVRLPRVRLRLRRRLARDGGRRPAHRRHHAGLPGAPRRAGHLRRRGRVQRVHRQARPVAAGHAGDGRHRVAGLGAAHPRHRDQRRRGAAGQPARPGPTASTCCPTWPPPASAPRSSTRSRPARSPASA